MSIFSVLSVWTNVTYELNAKFIIIEINREKFYQFLCIFDLNSNILSTESDINTYRGKVWITFDRLMTT